MRRWWVKCPLGRLDSHCMLTACHPAAKCPNARAVMLMVLSYRCRHSLKPEKTSVITQGFQKETTHGENDICHSRQRRVGVILYACSQAQDVVGNCMAPVTERFIFAYIWVNLSDEGLSVVTCGVNVWQIIELTNLAQENIKSDTEPSKNCVGLLG